MQTLILVLLSINNICVRAQTTQSPDYTCNQNNATVQFTFSTSFHSAWSPSLNCSLQQCDIISNDTANCSLPLTPCFDYRTSNNTQYCAPAIECSILESCNNITYTCTSNTTVCIINSCCSLQPVCLPLLFINFCSSGITVPNMTTTAITSTTASATSLSTSTTSTTTTTAPSCTAVSSVGRIFNFSTTTASTTYTLYTYGFTATASSSGIVFAMQGDSGGANRYFVIDNVSVNRTTINTNILTNGDFEAGNLTGWTQFCATNANCGGSGTRYGQITTSNCYNGTYCYQDRCNSGGNFDYLMQLFPTVPGEYYVVSFYLRAMANGGSWDVYVLLY